MSLDADTIVDRRRMRRKLTFWRVLAVIVAICAVVAVEALERLGKSSAKAVIVHINSPGGTTSGSEQLFDSIKRLKEQKPLVVVVDGLAASGGYITALAADHIIALETSLVGSIGVLFQYPNLTDLMK